MGLGAVPEVLSMKGAGAGGGLEPGEGGLRRTERGPGRYQAGKKVFLKYTNKHRGRRVI
jgi:hypothetical protein